MAGLSEKEKEKQRNLMTFDLAKKFVGFITVVMDQEDDMAWSYLPNKMGLKNNKLSLVFELKPSYIQKEIEKLDKEQRKIDDPYGDGEFEEIPEEV